MFILAVQSLWKGTAVVHLATLVTEVSHFNACPEYPYSS